MIYYLNTILYVIAKYILTITELAEVACMYRFTYDRKMPSGSYMINPACTTVYKETSDLAYMYYIKIPQQISQ